jgi:hypothetical protein
MYAYIQFWPYLKHSYRQRPCTLDLDVYHLMAFERPFCDMCRVLKGTRPWKVFSLIHELEQDGKYSRVTR